MRSYIDGPGVTSSVTRGRIPIIVVQRDRILKHRRIGEKRREEKGQLNAKEKDSGPGSYDTL